MAAVLGGAADIQDTGGGRYQQAKVLRAGHVPVPQVSCRVARLCSWQQQQWWQQQHVFYMGQTPETAVMLVFGLKISATNSLKL